MRCPYCLDEVPEFRFCDQCGKSLAPREHEEPPRYEVPDEDDTPTPKGFEPADVYARTEPPREDSGGGASARPPSPGEEKRDPDTVTAEERLDAGDSTGAGEALARVPRSEWGQAEYGLSLRLHLFENDFPSAKMVYEDLREAFSVAEAPELYYCFAVFAEKMGHFGEAKAIYKKLVSSLETYKDARARLKILKGLSEDELTRVTTLIGGKAAPSGEVRAPEGGELVGGRYKIIGVLGAGGMGAVFKAEDQRIPRTVALKRVRDEISRDDEAKALFLDEIKTIAALSHPCIVSFHDIIETEDTTYMMFEFVEGETIARLIASRGRILPRETIGILRHVCEALDYAHDQKVIHLDIKPANIMRSRGYVKVMDFGIARHMGRTGEAGAGYGTSYYMAPEQEKGKPCLRSDIFSLGVTAYEMLTGKLPFEGDDLYEQKMEKAYKPIPMKFTGKLRELVAGCLSSSPDDRPKDIRTISKVLTELS